MSRAKNGSKCLHGRPVPMFTILNTKRETTSPEISPSANAACLPVSDADGVEWRHVTSRLVQITTSKHRRRQNIRARHRRGSGPTSKDSSFSWFRTAAVTVEVADDTISRRNLSDYEFAIGRCRRGLHVQRGVP